jgi:two-component system CheB/CheR fusion protein
VVVGIGASAGGLEALTRFFEAMRPGSGMAFVVIQHLDPTHESLTAELLGKHTKMPVRQVAGDTAVERDCVYVIPPRRDLSIGQGVLRLTALPEGRARRMPVDFFFRSLAEDLQERAIGIVLSGSGTDGTLGLKEIKTVGGMALVQDPTTAQHDGVPRSAIASDAADHVLAVEKMPEVLLRYARHTYVAVAKQPPIAEKAADDLTRVLALVRARLHFDFSAYKPATIVRRIRRRMGLRHVERLPDYLQILRTDPGELRSLFKDLLIGVTRFFRDPEACRRGAPAQCAAGASERIRRVRGSVGAPGGAQATLAGSTRRAAPAVGLSRSWNRRLRTSRGCARQAGCARPR